MTVSKIAMSYVSANSSYQSAEGLCLKREHNTRTPAGNYVNGRWVLRRPDGRFLDIDRYRNDLAERNNLQLLGND